MVSVDLEAVAVSIFHLAYGTLSIVYSTLIPQVVVEIRVTQKGDNIELYLSPSLYSV